MTWYHVLAFGLGVLFGAGGLFVLACWVDYRDRKNIPISWDWR